MSKICSVHLVGDIRCVEVAVVHGSTFNRLAPERPATARVVLNVVRIHAVVNYDGSVKLIKDAIDSDIFPLEVVVATVQSSDVEDSLGPVVRNGVDALYSARR